MLKYTTVAIALKLFSSCSGGRQLYRAVANNLGGRRRAHECMPSYYLKRINRLLRFNRKYMLLKDGDVLVELGTGWLHWDAITARLFFNIQAVLYDVWDNRQLDGLRNYIGQLDNMLEGCDVIKPVREQAHNVIQKIRDANSFEELYDFLGFTYFVEKSGKLDKMENDSADVAISSGVLEHIKEDILPDYLRNIYRLLKPGGYSIHGIDLSDHLSHYDKGVSPKKYLSFSDATWKFWFENEVQYFNRKQRPEWIELFRNAGLRLIEEEGASTDLRGQRIGEKYHSYDISDLERSYIFFIHQKPKLNA